LIFGAVMIGVLVTMALALARAIAGPTVFDRILALNTFGTKTVLLISVVSFLYGRPSFIDLALTYALMNFIGVIAVLRFSQYGHFGETESDAHDVAIDDESL